MLKIEDFTREFPVNRRTDRDAEIPLLLEYLQKLAPINSLLDVGAHSSTDNNYGTEVREMVELYDGVDIVYDSQAAKTLDHFFTGNPTTLFPKPKESLYDIVICVSTIEHAGVSTYKKDNVQKEQNELFETCLRLAKKHMWISFPTGLTYVYPDQLSIISNLKLQKWERLIQRKGYKLTERFLHNQGGPQSGTPWREHHKREAACKQQYFDYIGNSSITIMEIDKI